MASIKDAGTIDRFFTKQDGAIEEISGDDGKDDKVDIIEANNTKVLKSVKSKDLVKLKEVRASFFTPSAWLAFIQLRQVFIKSPILYYFDPECHIRFVTDTSDFVTSGVLSQLITDGSSQCYLLAFYS